MSTPKFYARWKRSDGSYEFTQYIKMIVNEQFKIPFTTVFLEIYVTSLLT